MNSMVDQHEEETPDTGAKSVFLAELAGALQVYGVPSHRLEEALNDMAHTLGLRAQFLTTPTAIVSSIGTRTRLQRIDQGQTNLERLSDLHQIMADVRKGTLGPVEATDRIRAYSAEPPRYGFSVTGLAFTLASATAALLFQGSWRESAGAAITGGLIGALVMLSEPHSRLARLIPTLAGFMAAFVAHGLAVYAPPVFPFLTTLAGLIILVPGLTLTIAMNELAHNHLVSGTARLTGASITFLQLGFGAAIGWKLSPWIGEATLTTDPESVAQWMQWLTLPVASIAFVVLFRAHPRDYWAILIGALVAYGSSRWGSQTLGPEAGMALGAWSLGCTSTLVARIRRRPSAITLLPGLLLLVPGSLGIRSLQALVSRDVPLGVESAFSMTLLAMALVTGLFLANLTFRPRQL